MLRPCPARRRCVASRSASGRADHPTHACQRLWCHGNQGGCGAGTLVDRASRSAGRAFRRSAAVVLGPLGLLGHELCGIRCRGQSRQSANSIGSSRSLRSVCYPDRERRGIGSEPAPAQAGVFHLRHGAPPLVCLQRSMHGANSSTFSQPRWVASTAAGRRPTASTASGVSAPLCWLMRYDASGPMPCPRRTGNALPDRDRTRWAPPRWLCPAAVRCPECGSTAKAAMLLPLAARLPTSRSRPEGVRWICEQVVRSRDRRARSRSSARREGAVARSSRYAVTLQPCSFEK